MSEQEQMDVADIVGATREKSEGELILDLHLPQRAKDFGEGGDVPTPEESLLLKSEGDDGVSIKSNSSRNKSSSPASKRSSKRKRKNRRRREKKAAAKAGVVDGVGSISGVDDGTENEFSQNSEDVYREGEETETGTESETTCHEIELDQEISSVCVEPSLTTVTSIPEEEVMNDPMLEASDLQQSHGSNEETGMMRGESSVNSGNNRGPTHSVETLLQIAKCKILSRILEPVHEEEDNRLGAYQHGRSFTMSQDLNNTHDGNSSKLVVPPCSPSSLHNINSLENSMERNLSSDLPTTPLETQKSGSGGMKNVHFHEGPPEVRTADDTHEDEPEQIFDLKLDTTTDEYTVLDTPVITRKTPSKEAIILIENVAQTDSATSSVVSEMSSVSLLKANGSSNEDFAGSSHHYPSLETIDESMDDAKENSKKMIRESFKETIQIFKIQNPVEAKYIGNEVDSILTKSLDKFTNLMEGTAESDDENPIFVSDNNVVIKKTHENIIDVQNANAKKSIPKESVNEPESKSFIVNEYPAEETERFDALQDPSATMNTTFTIEKTDLEPDTIASFRLLSPGEIIPKAIPDMVSDTESVSVVAVGGLSIVLEEDEDDDAISTSTNNVQNTANEAPTTTTVTSRPPSPSQADTSDKQGCSCARCVIT